MKLRALLLLAALALASAADAAVVRGEGHYTYFGLAADTKPVSAQAGDRFIETDRQGREYVYTGSAWVRTPKSVISDGAGAGERNESSSTGTDYTSVSPECKPSGEIDISAGSGTIYNGPAIVQWVQVSTTPGTAASTIDDNATAKIPLPVSFPVGVYPLSGTVFCTSLKYTRGASATGKMNVCYRPLDSTQVTWACP